MPECCVQWCVIIPFRRRPICLARGILQLEGWPRLAQRGILGYIAEESVCVVDVKVARVDFVEAEGAVQVSGGCYAGHDPAGC